jgi:hypothetical protein
MKIPNSEDGSILEDILDNSSEKEQRNHEMIKHNEQLLKNCYIHPFEREQQQMQAMS